MPERDPKTPFRPILVLSLLVGMPAHAEADLTYGQRPASLIDRMEDGPLKTQLASGGGWYFKSVAEVVGDDGDYYEVLDVLAQDVDVVGVFSDWLATVTF